MTSSKGKRLSVDSKGILSAGAGRRRLSGLQIPRLGPSLGTRTAPTVLLHLINLSKSKPAGMAMTHLAAIFTYSLVIYGTFLTRSGILGDFSVHSFSNSNVGLIIAIINAIVLIGGLFILMQKVQYLPKGKMYESFSDRAFLILLGSLILIFVAVIVWIGMSMPLLTAALDNPAAVDTDFYTRTTSPLAIVIALLIIIIFAKYKLKGISRGGIITHIGVLMGLIAITYKGQTFTEDGTAKYYVYDVDGEEVRALTKLRGSGEDSAREPAILHKVTGDVYIAPSPPQNTENSELILELKKPFIWLLWLSASAVVVGTLIAIKQ